jgi:hypothetical protein
MTADYERAVVDHVIELWEEAGELLALIEVSQRSIFSWSRILRFDRTGVAEASARNFYTMPSNSRVLWVLTRSNSTQTRRLRRTFNSTPVAGARNFNEWRLHRAA